MIIGVLGGGQLGSMLAQAGLPLGFQFRFLDPNPQSPAGRYGELIVGDYDDAESLQRLATGAACVTFEFENVPYQTVESLQRLCRVAPNEQILQTAQDRLAEKQLFVELGVATPRFAAIDSQADLDRCLADGFPTPAILKTRRMGYDGKGQLRLSNQAESSGAFAKLGSTPLILEEFISFESEASILAVRSLDGDLRFYPLIENSHERGILLRSEVPAPSVDASMQRLAESAAQMILERFKYVGVLAIEFFIANGKLMANEMAPRVHNTGHWSIEGAVTSQFENHIRAIMGLPLGETAVRSRSVMFNLIGEAPRTEQLLGFPLLHLHLYGKSSRAGRKIGHVTLCEQGIELFEETLDSVAGLIGATTKFGGS